LPRASCCFSCGRRPQRCCPPLRLRPPRQRPAAAGRQGWLAVRDCGGGGRQRVRMAWSGAGPPRATPRLPSAQRRGCWKREAGRLGRAATPAGATVAARVGRPPRPCPVPWRPSEREQGACGQRGLALARATRPNTQPCTLQALIGPQYGETPPPPHRAGRAEPLCGLVCCPERHAFLVIPVVAFIAPNPGHLLCAALWRICLVAPGAHFLHITSGGRRQSRARARVTGPHMPLSAMSLPSK
jgi:hypothetical protein